MSFKIRAKKEQSPSPISSLPEEVLVDIVARVPRFYYPTLSLVSRRSRSLIASPELYARRSSLGFAEACIYAVLSNRDTKEYRLYILRQTANSNRLVLIPSIPHISPFGSFVPVGSKIYIVGEKYGFEFTSNAVAIHCGTHTVQPISSIPNRMAGTVADVIERKIYVVGYYLSSDYNPVSRLSLSKKVMVFDTETEMWEPEMIKPEMEIGHGWSGSSVVMVDKIYITDSENSFIYKPEENKWEMD